MPIFKKYKGKIVKCQLCDEDIKFSDTFIIKNKFNGNELRICKNCGKEFGWI